MIEEPDEFQKEMALRNHDRLDALGSKITTAVIESGIVTVRTLVLVNGGAVIAMLAFLANVVPKGDPNDFDGVLGSLSLFAFGVFAATMTAAFTYLTNLFNEIFLAKIQRTWVYPFQEKTKGSKRWGAVATVFQFVAIASGIASMVFFLWGVWSLKAAMLGVM
ncbi:hypothetical protein [Ruegeria arenilitoris]|uniref:hypothetical protein n=1 Tax=Ruegeria arenilitoris TaxID=1173585 RepID=UPI003C7992C3